MIDAQDSELLKELVTDATAAGIKKALSDPDMWAAASEGMRKHAATEAGGWLISGVKAGVSRIAWIMLIGLGVYLIGGWAALVSLFKASH